MPLDRGMGQRPISAKRRGVKRELTGCSESATLPSKPFACKLRMPAEPTVGLSIRS